MVNPDIYIEEFVVSPTEENGKKLMRFVAKSFSDKSFTDNHFNKIQDLITSESANKLQFGGFNFSEHLSNTLRSCFKHNKRNDLIVLLRPSSVIKFADINSFGDDTVKLIKPNVIAELPKYKINYNNKDMNTISAMKQVGGNDSDQYSSSYNFRTVTSKSVSSPSKISSEKREIPVKLLGGNLTESLEFTTLKSKPLAKKLSNDNIFEPTIEIKSPRDTDEPMPSKTESSSFVKFIEKKTSSGSFKRPTIIKTNPDVLTRKKSYELRKKDNKNELSLMITTEKGGQGIITDTSNGTNLDEIEATIDKLSELSKVNITKIDPEDAPFKLEYPDLGLKLSVDCLLDYMVDPNINNEGVCEQKYIQQLVDLNGNLDVDKYFDSDTNNVDEKTHFVNKSMELYQFITDFVTKVEFAEGINKYDDDTKARIRTNLHNLISNYVQYVSNKITQLSIINNDLINSATNLISAHNRLIYKELDDGTTLIDLDQHLKDFYKLSADNLSKVNELGTYLSIKPDEIYDPTLISEIKNRAEKLEEKIKSLEAISNEMKANLEAFNMQVNTE